MDNGDRNETRTEDSHASVVETEQTTSSTQEREQNHLQEGEHDADENTQLMNSETPDELLQKPLVHRDVLEEDYEETAIVMDDTIRNEDYVNIPSTKFHLSEVNLLSGTLRNEELEIKHSIVEHEATRELAAQIFEEWDILKDGTISVLEIESSGIDGEFSQALGRVMDVGATGSIVYEDLVNCLTILKFGTMKAKVALLVKFMDRDGDHQISFEEANVFVKAAPYEICKKMGLIGSDGDLNNNTPLQYEDILRLFEMSDRGEDAINIFCGHITGILKSKIRPTKHPLAAAAVLCIGLTDIKKAWRNLLSRIKFLPRSSIFITALLAIQAALWELNFSYYQGQGYPYSFCVAKGFGLNLRILTILLFLSMARSTMGILHDIKFVQLIVPMGFNLQIHSFIGFCVLGHALGHMLGHIAYHSEFVDGGLGHAFVQKSLLRGAAWADKGAGDGITGFLLLLMIMLMAGTALQRGNGSKGYKIFSNTHFLYTLWLGVLFLHVPSLWPWFVSIGALFATERAYDFFKQTTHSTLASSRPCGKNVTFLSVPRSSLPSYPGSYFRIKVPEISRVEFHPFSLAGSVSSHHLTFFVAATGDWTRELFQIVSDPVRRAKTSIQVQGPFYAPARTAVKSVSKRTLLVASGIGITPFFSVMATRVAEEAAYEADKEVYQSLFNESLDSRGKSYSTIKGMKKLTSSKPSRSVSSSSASSSGSGSGSGGEEEVEVLHVVWTIRDVSELMFYLDYVYELIGHQQALTTPAVMVEVYLTGIGKGTDLSYMMTQTLFLLTMASKTSQYMKIYFHRPDMNAILDTVQPAKVYYCGGKVLKDMLSKLCIEKDVPFHPEDFDSGTSVVKNTVAFFRKVFCEKSKKQEDQDRRQSVRLKRQKSVLISSSGDTAAAAVEMSKV